MLGVVLDLTRAILAPTSWQRRRPPPRGCGVTARRRATVTTAPERLSKTRQFKYLHTHTKGSVEGREPPTSRQTPTPNHTSVVHAHCTRVATQCRAAATLGGREDLGTGDGGGGEGSACGSKDGDAEGGGGGDGSEGSAGGG